MCFFYVAPFAYGAERDNVELSLMLPKFFASLPTNNKDRKTCNHQPVISDPFYLFVLPSLIKYPP